MRNAFIAGITSIAMVLVMVNIPIKYFSYNHWFNPNFGTSLTTISSSDQLSDFPTTYNANLAALNAGKIEVSTTTLPLITTLANLTTTGTIGTGVWQGTTIDELYGGTGFNTYATGDLIYASGTNTLSKLTASSTNEVLTLVGGVPVWRDAVVNEANNYNWTGLHTFTNASSTLFSAYTSYFGATATSTFDTGGNLSLAGTLGVGGVTYTFPAANGASSTVLANNGSGTLYWDTSGALGAGALLVASTTDTTVTESATETDYGSGTLYTLPASYLGTNGGISVKVSVPTYTNSDAGGNNGVVRVYYGATAVCTATLADVTASTVGADGWINFMIFNDDSASSQRCIGDYYMGEDSIGFFQFEGSSSVDTSSSQAVKVTLQMDNGVGTQTFTIGSVSITSLGRI